MADGVTIMETDRRKRGAGAPDYAWPRPVAAIALLAALLVPPMGVRAQENAIREDAGETASSPVVSATTVPTSDAGNAAAALDSGTEDPLDAAIALVAASGERLVALIEDEGEEAPEGDGGGNDAEPTPLDREAIAAVLAEIEAAAAIPPVTDPQVTTVRHDRIRRARDAAAILRGTLDTAESSDGEVRAAARTLASVAMDGAAE